MIGVVCAIAILSCRMQSKESEAPTPSSTQDVPAETAETEYQPEPVETHEGEVRSFYTGEWMDEKKAKNRPVAVMTENTHVPFRSMESEMRILSMNVRWKAALPG